MAVKSAKTGLKSAELRAVVIRADGTVEDLGVIAYYSDSWIKRTAFSVSALVKRIFKGK